jgi:hypothetical protein
MRSMLLSSKLHCSYLDTLQEEYRRRHAAGYCNATMRFRQGDTNTAAMSRLHNKLTVDTRTPLYQREAKAAPQSFECSVKESRLQDAGSCNATIRLDKWYLLMLQQSPDFSKLTIEAKMLLDQREAKEHYSSLQPRQTKQGQML